jgi:hypothetical protein
VFRRLCLGVQPALGRDEDPGAAESDDRAQGQPGEWSDQEWHDRSRCGDQTSKCGVGADVPDPFDDSAATCCAQCEADEVAAEYRPAIVASKSSIATRKEKKVPRIHWRVGSRSLQCIGGNCDPARAHMRPCWQEFAVMCCSTVLL